MGTLSKQLIRSHYRVDSDELDEYLSTASELSKKHKISLADVIAAGRVLEIKRTNELYLANGEAFDEQIAGIGELLESVAMAINNVASSNP